MKVLVYMDSNGHFGVVSIEDEIAVLRDIMRQVSTRSSWFNNEAMLRAAELAEQGDKQEILDWLEEHELGFGRSNGGRIDIVDCHDQLPECFLRDML